MVRKLNLNATKSVKEDKSFDLTIDNTLAIKSYLAQAAHKFGWNAVVVILLTYDASGIISRWII